MSRRQAGRWRKARERIKDLTEREYQVFVLLGEGLDNHKISLHLEIAERTVKLHITRLLRKLGVESRLQAGIVAAEHALLVNARRSDSTPLGSAFSLLE